MLSYEKNARNDRHDWLKAGYLTKERNFVFEYFKC